MSSRILIQEDFDWDAHVAKVNNQARIRQKSLVRRPHLEYAVQAWRPYKQKDVNQIEKVQRRATKMIRGLCSQPHDQRLQRTNLFSLEMKS